jgi:anti-sigma factor ChrR (cupin superfamily)
MPSAKAARSSRLADQFEAAQEDFIRLVEALTVEHWRMRGQNTPDLRINNEDENRPVGVIAHHVAVNQDWIMSRINAIVEDKPTPPVDFKQINAHHANEHAHATRAEVLALLRDSKSRIAREVRAIRDHELDKERQLPSGTMTVQQRIERVLIGHMKSHQASIEATIS